MINSDDILYEDKYVRILKPNVKKGVLVWHRYPKDCDVDIPSIGLKSGKQMQEEGIDFGRTKIHPYIFFRAPFHYNKIDYTSIETELLSSYDTSIVEDENLMIIRIDPEYTKVYSGEIRASRSPGEWKKSEKKMTEYFRFIHAADSMQKCEEVLSGEKKCIWHLFTSGCSVFPKQYKPSYPWDKYPINRLSEVLVHMGHMPPEYFVKREKN